MKPVGNSVFGPSVDGAHLVHNQTWGKSMPIPNYDSHQPVHDIIKIRDRRDEVYRKKALRAFSALTPTRDQRLQYGLLTGMLAGGTALIASNGDARTNLRDALIREAVKLQIEHPEWSFYLGTIIHDPWRTDLFDTRIQLHDFREKSRRMATLCNFDGFLLWLEFQIGDDGGSHDFMVWPNSHFIGVSAAKYHPNKVAKALSELPWLYCANADTVHISRRLPSIADVARVASYLGKEPHSGKDLNPNTGDFDLSEKVMTPTRCLRMTEVLSHLDFNDLIMANGVCKPIRKRVFEAIGVQSGRPLPARLPCNVEKFWRDLRGREGERDAPVIIDNTKSGLVVRDTDGTFASAIVVGGEGRIPPRTPTDRMNALSRPTIEQIKTPEAPQVHLHAPQRHPQTKRFSGVEGVFRPARCAPIRILSTVERFVQDLRDHHIDPSWVESQTPEIQDQLERGRFLGKGRSFCHLPLFVPVVGSLVEKVFITRLSGTFKRLDGQFFYSGTIRHAGWRQNLNISSFPLDDARARFFRVAQFCRLPFAVGRMRFALEGPSTERKNGTVVPRIDFIAWSARPFDAAASRLRINGHQLLHLALDGQDVLEVEPLGRREDLLAAWTAMMIRDPDASEGHMVLDEFDGEGVPFRCHAILRSTLDRLSHGDLIFGADKADSLVKNKLARLSSEIENVYSPVRQSDAVTR